MVDYLILIPKIKTLKAKAVNLDANFL